MVKKSTKASLPPLPVVDPGPQRPINGPRRRWEFLTYDLALAINERSDRAKLNRLLDPEAFKKCADPEARYPVVLSMPHRDASYMRVFFVLTADQQYPSTLDMSWEDFGALPSVEVPDREHGGEWA